MKKKVGKGITAEHPIVAKKIDESLNLSVREGSLASVSAGFGLSYFSPFALAMNATSTQVGILYAITSLLPSVVQLRTSKLLERFSRKKLVLRGVLGKILLWIPILITGLLFYLGVPHMVWVFIGLVSLFYVLTAISHPAWFSWMGSLVPEERRGKYFSRRNRAAGFFGVLTMIAGAIILDGAKSIGGHYGDVVGFTLLGFGLLFVLSALVRIRSMVLLSRQYEPKIKVRKKDYFSCWQFLKRCVETPFGRFTIFRGVLSFAVGIAGPFWAVYMLRDLGFSYVWYMLITVSSISFQLMFLPLLGKVSDKFGNVRLMTICSWFIVMTPVLWLVSALIESSLWLKVYLLFVPAIVGGFAWAGYNLAVNNYVYDAVSGPKRSFGLTYMNLMVGIGMFLGASLGSLVAWVGVSFMNTLLFIFAISAVGRLLVAIIGLRFLKEVRHVGKFSSHYLIKEFRPMQGVVREIHHLNHVVKKVEHHLS
jgi:MFS family permease